MPKLGSKLVKNSLGFLVGSGIGILPFFVLNGASGALSRRPPSFDYNAPPHLKAERVFRIVAFGSSSTLGTGASSSKNTYPARLERLLNDAPGSREAVDVINRGIGGEDTPMMMNRLPSDILSREPHLVIWQMGSNDALHHVPIDVFEDDLRAGIKAIRQAGAEVMVMEPQWCPQIERTEPTGRYVEVIHQVTDDLHVALIPRFELMRLWIAKGLATENELIGPDHLHSTDRGYELLAQAVFDIVVRRSERYKDRVGANLSAAVGSAPSLR